MEECNGNEETLVTLMGFHTGCYDPVIAYNSLTVSFCDSSQKVCMHGALL